MTFSAPITALILGVLFLAGSVAAFFPGRGREWLRRYPRSLWPGRILSVLCLIWFARNLTLVDMGGLNVLKNLLWVAVPASIYLVIVFVPDLLSVRGLCGLGLLAGNPLLIATRWQGTPASIMVGIWTYAVLVVCMVLIVYPHLWPRGIRRLDESAKGWSRFAVSGLLVSALLLGSALVSF